MESVINPALIYWINIIDAVRSLCVAIAVMSAILLCVALVGFVYNQIESVDHVNNKKYAEMCKKYSIILCICLGISLLFSIFVPWKETVIEMIVASYITPNNIELGIDGLKSVIDYVVEAVAKLM